MRTLFATILPVFSLVVLTPGLFGAEPASAPAPGPLPGSRVLRTFDFEETALGNFENIPMYWSKVVGKGFPAYSGGAFDRTVSRSPNTSFKLETTGGSVAYRLNPPPEKRIPIHPDSDYYVLAFVKSAQLKHARADVTAWFADDQGNLLPATEVHSQPYVSTTDKNDPDTWRVLYLYMPGPSAPTNATSLVLQVGLLQPQQLPPGAAPEPGKPNLGRFEIYQQDIQGALWFDDVVVFQLPRVAVTVPSSVTGSMFTAKQNVDLDIVVSDMANDPAQAPHPLDTRLKITNPEGLVLASERWSATATAQQSWKNHYTHAPLPPGLYTATLEVMDNRRTAPGGESGVGTGSDVIIARRQTQFLSLPPTSPLHAAPEFGLSVAGRSPRSATDMLTLWPALLQSTGAGLVQLPVWRRDSSDDALLRRDQTFDALLNTLEHTGVRAIGTFSTIPTVLAKKLPPSTTSDSESVLTLLNASAEIWKPYFSFALTRYANRLETWELGETGSPFSGDINDAGAHDRYVTLYSQVAPEIASLLNRPQLLVPWNALVDFDPHQFPNASLDLRLPAVIKPSQIPAYIDNFRFVAPSAATPFAPKIFAHIEALDAKGLAHADRLADFAQRLVFAKSAAPTGILYDAPGNTSDELLLVYRAIIHAIGNATYVGELPVAPGVHAFLFNRGEVGSLVLWTDSANEEVPLDLPLGATPVLSDLLGAQRVLALDPATGLSRVVATNSPIILENLDPRPLQLKTSFALATGNFPSGAGSVHTEVLLKNPYNDTLAGNMRISVQKGWSTDPSSIHFALAPGATLHQPIIIRYPFTENAGKKEFTAVLSLENSPGITAQELKLSFPCAITSDLVQMEGFAQMLDNGDILIQQMVTNISDSPLSAQAYAVLPNYPRQQRYVVSLAPGQTTIKRFSFAASSYTPEGKTNITPADIAAALAGQTATLGLQANGKVLLTKTIPLE